MLTDLSQEWLRKFLELLLSDAADLGKMMGAVEVTIAQKAGENDQLFGSVTASDVSVALEKLGYTIDRRKVHLEEPIKTLGDFFFTETPRRCTRSGKIG